MRSFTGRVTEIQLDYGGIGSAWIDCPGGALPAAGQYLLARATDAVEAPLAIPLFAREIAIERFLTVAPIPPGWVPGTRLFLRGPLGRGFQPPRAARRFALVALGETVARLLPLVRPALEQEAAITLFTDLPLPSLPASVEAYPLASFIETLPWADFLALDLSVDSLPALRQALGLAREARLPCPAQALLIIGMPCGGMAECGACAVLARRKWKLACKDGPVFPLDELEW